jgi:hypothetical protein
VNSQRARIRSGGDATGKVPPRSRSTQGKEGALELLRLQSGCGTWEEFWASRGKNGRKQVFKRIDEVAEAMAYAKSKKGPGYEDGVPFEYIMTMKPGTPTTGNNQDGNNQDGNNNQK